MATRAEIRKKNYRIKRKKRIIKTIKFLLVLGALYAVIFCTPFFNIKTIEVEGTVTTSAQSVISASGIVQGRHILKLDKHAAEKGIEKLAYVKNATVKKQFPNKVKILVEEGKVCANIALAKGFAAIDETGKIMEIVDSAKTGPVIYGFNVKKSEVGEKITIDETGQLDVILKYRAVLSEQALPVPFVSMTYKEETYSVEFENGIVAFFGDKNDIDYKVAAFAESFRTDSNITSGYFDVSIPERIVYSKSVPGEETEEENKEETSADEHSVEEE